MIEKVSPWYAPLFLGYIALVVFAVIRIVTALFLQETLANASNDADMILENSRRLAKDYQDKLEELFQAADNDGDGSLTPDEFVEALSIPGVQRCSVCTVFDVLPLRVNSLVMGVEVSLFWSPDVSAVAATGPSSWQSRQVFLCTQVI